MKKTLRIDLSNALSALSIILLFAGCSKTEEEPAEVRDNTAEVEAYYASKPDFFTFATLDDLPDNLEWTTGTDLPEFSSPDAKKGGTAYGRIPDFPRTLRHVGPDSNGSFRPYILDDVTVSPAHEHPNKKGEFYPGTAKEWAIDWENKTVYVRLNPEARWSDGEPVTTEDFFFMFFFFQSSYIHAPWYNNFYTEFYTNITSYDDLTYSISVAERKPNMPVYVLGLAGKPRHFYKGLGDDYPEYYQWKFVPTTGPYIINDEDIKKGKSITLTRLKDWWAKDLKYWRNRYNPDRIHLTVIRDTPKAFEAFKKGELDGFSLNLADYWYNKLPDDAPEVQKGYIHKVVFYNDIPRPTYGLWINSAKPLLKNRDIRVGINYASNWELVIEKYFRGDATRMRTTADGYGSMSHPTLKAREFSVEKALESFAKAGFTKRGPDGILVNAEGQRLSFTLSTGYDWASDLLTILQEEAKKAGLEIKVEILDSTASWKKVQEKNHEIHFSAFGVGPELYPRYWETFHSVNANKTQTNNLTNTAIPELDKLIEAYRASDDLDAMRKMAYKMEEILHDDAAFVPGFVQPFYRAGFWRWIRYPDNFNVKLSSSPGEYFLSWIDQDMKKETLEAKKSGKTFPPQILVYDQYKPE